MDDFPEQLRVVDSHTEGEPTRVILEGWPLLRGEAMLARRQELVERFDRLRRGVVLEPRGFEALVGALVTPPVSVQAHCGVVFFNNVGPLGMCGHGLIGLVETLRFLGRITPGSVHIDTPAGLVAATLAEDGLITIRNVPSHCYRRDVSVDVPGLGKVHGDISYGGNWFFLVHPLADVRIHLSNRARLLEISTAVMSALHDQGICGEDGAVIDHVELFGPPTLPEAHSKNWVLCPGGEYDRSPCGTGTSAKMVTLHAHGRLQIGEVWKQESITGSLFTGWLTLEEGRLIPHIQGRAFITAQSTLLFDRRDPFRAGLG